MNLYSDLPHAVGNTPLIRLKKASEITGCDIYGKAEFLNPGQSVKDRAALNIIKNAIQSGSLQPGVGFCSLLEPRLSRTVIRILIGVVLDGQLPISLLNVCL